MASYRISAVSFLNTRPLIYGLSERAAVQRDVPSRLLEHLENGQADAALLSVLDLQRCDQPLRVLPAGCIASSGETLTVRVFSRLPASQIERLHADTDSHTSVALARVLWAERFGRRLSVIEHHGHAPLPDNAQAVLLIGDKVVTSPPADMPYEYDLGLLWWQWTQRPFTFAVWAAREDVAHQELHHLLHDSAMQGRLHIDEIIELAQREHGWPAALARTYLTQNLEFRFTSRHRAGMELFFQLCHKQGILEQPRHLHYHEHVRSSMFDVREHRDGSSHSNHA